MSDLNRNWVGELLCFERASHLCICEQCNKLYIDHPMDLQELDWLGQPYLHILCDKSRVKL